MNVDKNELKTIYKKKAVKRPRPTTKRCNIINFFGFLRAGILFNFGKAAGKTVAEQASKLKTTVEEKVRAGC